MAIEDFLLENTAKALVDLFKCSEPASHLSIGRGAAPKTGCFERNSKLLEKYLSLFRHWRLDIFGKIGFYPLLVLPAMLLYRLMERHKI